MSRREFLRVALPVSVVSVAAAGMALRGLTQLDLSETSGSSQYAYAQDLSTVNAPSTMSTPTRAPVAATQAAAVQPTPVQPLQVLTTQFNSTAACTVLCSRHCSYPGHCRRYIDQNNNHRCDRGECLSVARFSGDQKAESWGRPLF